MVGNSKCTCYGTEMGIGIVVAETSLCGCGSLTMDCVEPFLATDHEEPYFGMELPSQCCGTGNWDVGQLQDKYGECAIEVEARNEGEWVLVAEART